MKKLMIVAAFLLTSVSVLMAQQIKKTSRLKIDEVPVAVRAAFEHDFGKIPEAGSWMVAYYVVNEGTRTAAKPVSYTFVKGRKAEKIEIRYTPEGKLESSKGMEKINVNS